MGNYGFGGARPTFRYSPDDDPTKGYIPQGNRPDPSVVTQNQNLLPSPETTPKTSQPSMYEAINREMANRPQRQALEGLIKDEPSREQYQPNKMTRLGAILGGASAGFRDPAKGVELAQSMIDRPYNEAVDAHERRLKNVSALAGLEGQDLQNKITGLTEDERTRQWGAGHQENIRQSDRSFTEGVRQSDRSFGEGQRQFGLSHELDKDRLNEQSWYEVKNQLTGQVERRNARTGANIGLGQLMQTPGQEMADKKSLYNATIGATNLADIKSREKIASETNAMRKTVADIRANNARIVGQMSVGADEAVKRQMTILSNELNEPKSPLFNIDIDDYTTVGPTGTRVFKPGIMEDPARVDVARLLSNFLKIDAGQGKGAIPNQDAQDILDRYRRSLGQGAAGAGGS